LVELFQTERDTVGQTDPIAQVGRVRRVAGLAAEVEGAALPVGAGVRIRRRSGGDVPGEVVGFRDDVLFVMPLGDLRGVARFDPVHSTTAAQRIGVSEQTLGRVIDSFGRPLDEGPPILPERFVPLYRGAPPPMERPRITEPLPTGIRAIDGLATLGRGQRVGLFSGSGVGKSILLGMIARNTEADVTVLALVGERGREVRDFVEKDLGSEGRRRAVVVVETADRPALLRVRAPFAATAVAEYFRDRGLHVLLLMDSITRAAMSQREIGLSIGEPPATRGYPPSVFALFPRLMERAGPAPRGSITGIYNVLVEADDMNEPISDAVRGILDGHLWLSRALAERAQYPAVDPLASISRLMIDVVGPAHLEAAARLKGHLAVYRDAEDMISIGAYAKGSNPRIDEAIERNSPTIEFLKQGIREKVTYAETVERLQKIAAPKAPAGSPSRA
jgi:flagellum-specific ATP synthase